MSDTVIQLEDRLMAIVKEKVRLEMALAESIDWLTKEEDAIKAIVRELKGE